MTLDRFTCEEVFERLDDYLDRELSSDETRLVREHLETCAVCASEYQFELTVITRVRERLRRIDVPPDLMTRIALELDRAGTG